jgi:hypothetical protein
MSTKFLGGQLGHWMKAIGISVVINSLMMLTMLSSVTKSLRWLGWISDVFMKHGLFC